MTNKQLRDATQVMIDSGYPDNPVNSYMEVQIKGPSIEALSDESLVVLAKAGFRYNAVEDIWEARPIREKVFC